MFGKKKTETKEDLPAPTKPEATEQVQEPSPELKASVEAYKQAEAKSHIYAPSVGLSEVCNLLFDNLLEQKRTNDLLQELITTIKKM